jgi:hypothetical protein
MNKITILTVLAVLGIFFTANGLTGMVVANPAFVEKNFLSVVQFAIGVLMVLIIGFMLYRMAKSHRLIHTN